MIPTSIDGTDITGATIDSTDVTEITVDGQTVFSLSTGPLFDGFEDGNINEYSGDTNNFNVQTSDVFEGNFAIENTSRFATIHRQDAMQPGATATVFMKGSGFPQVNFGYDGTDGYIANFNPPSQLGIFRKDGGSLTSLGTNSNVTLPTNSFFKGVIEYNPPNFTLEAFDLQNNSLGTFSATDSTYSNTGFGFRGDTGDIYDSITIS